MHQSIAVFCLAPKTREKHFCKSRASKTRSKELARPSIRPSHPRVRSFFARSVRNRLLLARSRPKATRETRARTRDTHTTLACTSQSFLDYAHFPEEPKKRRAKSARRRVDATFVLIRGRRLFGEHTKRRTRRRRREKKGAFKRTMVTKSRRDAKSDVKRDLSVKFLSSFLLSFMV